MTVVVSDDFQVGILLQEMTEATVHNVGLSAEKIYGKVMGFRKLENRGSEIRAVQILEDRRPESFSCDLQAAAIRQDEICRVNAGHELAVVTCGLDAMDVGEKHFPRRQPDSMSRK